MEGGAGSGGVGEEGGEVGVFDEALGAVGEGDGAAAVVGRFVVEDDDAVEEGG